MLGVGATILTCGAALGGVAALTGCTGALAASVTTVSSAAGVNIAGAGAGRIISSKVSSFIPIVQITIA